ncbi:bifunctional proline dehydrogenase/L-glutamate gamma-semialdehyde dehydrogenase PutA [Paracraurococcus sp. LOR1-02]|uniref:Bifunctional protein PutA n=2 Tax=Paracraurococcus lichenis TaxID=3064888 RepID=A0ABT9E3N2_9PROT|nr:bifunctional proline dehydrogenase/L-glutamate gamma-semialdehyde dehydrogenase PutA [Paracraurococcus sp. LOR1-02]MDO9710771.1 bifunctional proline dehydrogenase/L-glutamate gamma-semialdehyde dehydrogenase PutA [Paracraurococcus sp. LOR1-02]
MRRPPEADRLRAAIRAACRRPEPDCLPPLLAAAAPGPEEAAAAARTARDLVTRLRARPRAAGVEALVHEYALSSPEGVALMCLAEALLRIPDSATRDALIRDKIARGDWRAHLGHEAPLFVHAATWGLMLTGRLAAAESEAGLGAALTRLIARGGEPVIRRAMDLAMRMMGEQFVTGETIAEALRNARPREAQGFRFSYDMLGEAAATAGDAARYLASYEEAVEAIGAAAGGRGPVEGPGISVKLSALHPRYGRSQRGRVMAELLPRLAGLARLAARHDIGFNIDAEESERLDLSLDLLEALALDPALAGWEGLGFVVQAYGRRAPFVIDWVVDLARRSGRRIMLRLVKGAYWDSEIKRAQVEGQADFPVFTRKVHTDVSYLACARRLLAAHDAVFPQFATHNAQTLAAVLAMAGPEFRSGDYEFQCLHGMGEPLYEAVVGPLGRPCRVYAPVGTHETLLAYLVRRLLENGANSSFVHRIQDAGVSVEALAADPVAAARAIAPSGAPHPAIALPRDLYGAARRNSAGLDLADEDTLAMLAAAVRDNRARDWSTPGAGAPREIRNPADRRDLVGTAPDATPAEVEAALAAATAAAPAWAAMPAAARADLLRRAADALEAARLPLVALLVREAGKTLPNAIGEVREAADFLRYYAAGAEAMPEVPPLGPVACISPWNFPLAIFLGQVAAALAAGNTVLAKPAEETPLVAAAAVRLLHEAGLPRAALHLLPGAGEVGAALVGDARVQGVVFTGSTAVARLINAQLAGRLTADGQPVPLIAETGGINAMVVDSSALAEQVVADVLASAFDSAGQRCSALRILCVQEEAADRLLAMLRGAMRELAVGDPARIETDVGPVITEAARDDILGHVAGMRGLGFAVEQVAAPDGCFVPPTLIEVGRIADVGREVFGPVLHVLRYRREGLDRLLAEIAAGGHALTFGLHTRLDATAAHVLARVPAGNCYVNRNIIGATVGVQPFGGSGLSGTGPKAGGPLYLARLKARPVALSVVAGDLAGPVGESNRYALHPRGRIAALAEEAAALRGQVGAILAAGNRALVAADNPARGALGDIAGLEFVADPCADPALRAVVTDAAGEALVALQRRLAARDGPIVAVIPGGAAGCDPLRLVEERVVSTNTAAAGGNASLMAIG